MNLREDRATLAPAFGGKLKSGNFFSKCVFVVFRLKLIIFSSTVFSAVCRRTQHDLLRPRDIVADHEVAEEAGPRILGQLPERARRVAAERRRPSLRLALDHRARLREQLLRLRDCLQPRRRQPALLCSRVAHSG